MPGPQKNSGNKGAKRETGISMKNKRFIQNFLDDIRKDGEVDSVHVARVIAKYGNGRVQVFYYDGRPHVVQAVIRGSFRGKGKRSVFIETGSIVLIADSGIGGSAEFEIVAILSPEQVRDLRREMDIEPRVLAMEVTDAEQLMSGKEIEEGGFIIEAGPDNADDVDDKFVDNL